MPGILHFPAKESAVPVEDLTDLPTLPARVVEDYILILAREIVKRGLDSSNLTIDIADGSSSIIIERVRSTGQTRVWSHDATGLKLLRVVG